LKDVVVEMRAEIARLYATHRTRIVGILGERLEDIPRVNV
jgi:hypothetical protein